MSDERLRRLARRAREGDPDSRARLERERVRVGRLAPALGTPLAERATAWLEQRAIGGVVCEPVPVEPFADLVSGICEAIELTWWVPYDAPGQLLTLLRHLVDTLDWVDVRELSVAPLGSAEAYRCQALVLGYDPRQMLRGPEARAALSQPGADSETLSDRVQQALEAHYEALGEDEQAAFQEGVGQLFDTSIGGDREPGERFSASLEADVRDLLHDSRLVWDLRRSHQGLLEHVDDWLQRDRLGAGDDVVGVAIRFPVWGTFESIYGTDRVPEVASVSELEPDPAALLIQSTDAGLPEHRRRAAVDCLLALRDPGALRAQVALLGQGVQLWRLLTIPGLGAFWERFALEPDPARAGAALGALREGSWEQPLEAWSLVTSGTAELGLQCEALQHLPRSRPALLPRVVDAVRAHLGGVSRRSAPWLTAALGGLGGAGAAESLELSLAFVEDPDDELRAMALGSFYRADHPPAHPALLAALDDPALDVVSAAESGLVRQRTLSDAQRWDALARLDARAQRELTGDHPFQAQRLGADLIEALASTLTQLPAGQRDLVERVVVRCDRPLPGAQALLSGDPQGGQAVVPWLSNQRPTFAEAHCRWTAPGYVLERYRQGPHTDPRWDDVVAEGHALYDTRQGHAALPFLRRAAEAGCSDPLVLYRLGATLVSDDPVAAAERFRAAAARVGQDYPDSPYEACAWEAAATALSIAERDEEALAALRRAVALPLRPGGLERRLEQLERRCELLAVDPTAVRGVELAGLTPAPSRWHDQRVTSLALRAPSQGSLRLLSADAGGDVQLTRLSPQAPGSEVLPMARSRAHPPGRTVVGWETDETFLSAGVDGRLLAGRLIDDGLELEPVCVHGRPLRALLHLDSERVVLADDQGALLLLQREQGALETLRPADGQAGFDLLVLTEGGFVAAGPARLAERWVGSERVWTSDVAWPWVGPGDAEGSLRVVTAAAEAQDRSLESGGVVAHLAPPHPGTPGWCWRAGDCDVWAWPAGGIQYAGASQLRGITEPLEALTADPASGLVAYSDLAHRLSVLVPR